MRYVLPIVILTAIFATGLEGQVSRDEVTRPDEVNRNDSPPRSGVAPRVAPRVAVVLSGGGARGAAHIGVLRELEKAGVPIDLIVGTSFGAFVGGLYAVGYSTADIELIVQSMDWTHLLSNKMDRRLVDFSNKYRNDRQFELEMDEWNLKLPTGLQSGPRIQQLLDRLTAQVVLDANNDFDKLAVPFRAVATDILTGEPYLFKSGSLSTAIRSSIAIPGLLTPVEFENTLLIDGGVADILPIDLALAEGADVVIAVDVSKPLKNQKEQIESLVDILNQVAGFYAEQRKQANLKNPAIVITPVLGEMGLVDFDQSSLAIQRGVAAADQAFPDISRQLEAKGIQRNSPRPRVSLLDPTNLDLDHVTLSNKTIVPSEIHVEGLQRYPESYVLGYVSSQPGLPSSSTTLDHDISALYATGLFDAARYQLWKDERGTQLAYNLHERAPLQIGLGLRYDREYKFTSLIDMVGRDVVAIGSDLSLRVIAGGAESVEFGVNRKRIFGTNLIFSPQIHFRSQGRLIRESGEALGDYQDRRFGVQGSLQYFPGNLARVELAYQWDHVDIDRGVSRFIEPAARNLAGLKAGVRFDNLNNVDFPTGGTLGTLEFQWRSRNLGSDLTFSRSIVDLDHYFSSPFGTTIGLTANLGVVHGTAPFYESFFTGGAQDLSFASTRFPGLTRDEILSKRVGIVGMSFRRPIHHFQAGIFDDVYLNAEYKAGFFSRGSLDTWRSSNPLHGFGIGLYFDVHLLGPMLLELGKTDRTGLQPYFSIGHSF